MKLKSNFRWGLDGIAIFEAAKGLFVLLAGFGLLTFIHRDLQAFGERVVRHLHINPAQHYPKIFLDALAHLDQTHIVWISIGALVYSIIRFAEAYGIWRDRAWGEWLAILSGGLYLPIEIFELFHKFSYFKLVITTGNLLLVIYLINVRRKKLLEAAPAPDPQP